MLTPDPCDSESDIRWMRRAIELARRGEGLVEPNPMVGCVIVKDGRIVSQGWHQFFGGPHAERDALANAGPHADLQGATWYVTLEPCCHVGKTPPCASALIATRPQRLVCAMRDPFPLVNGGGFQEISNAGIDISLGVCAAEAAQLSAPFLKRVRKSRPWVIAKWAMSLDGKIAAASGDSRWISSPESRSRVHLLRGRCDAIMVGAGTAIADDPRLTARPAGLRTAVRIVVDRHASLPIDSQLVRTAKEIPLRWFVGHNADSMKVDSLMHAGVDVVHCLANDRNSMVLEVLDHCGNANMTNILVEGGGALLGALHDVGEIDEAHVFIAPKIIGGHSAPTPIGGQGLNAVSQASGWQLMHSEQVEQDMLMILRKKHSCPT